MGKSTTCGSTKECSSDSSRELLHSNHCTRSVDVRIMHQGHSTESGPGVEKKYFALATQT